MAYNGQIAELPIGSLGLFGSQNASQIPVDALLACDTITLESDTVQKEGGASKYNSSVIGGAPSVLGVHDWNHDGATQRLIVLGSDGKLYKDTFAAGTFATTLASGLTVSSVIPRFVEGGKEAAANNRKLFVFTWKNAVQVLSADGATTAALATPPADWTGAHQPAFGCNHEGRMWGGGNDNDPHRMYYSLTTNHEDFTSAGAGSISVYPGEGEKLVAAFAFRSAIICFKYPRGIYLIDTSDPTTTNWKVTKINGNLGAAGYGCAVQVEDDVVFVDASGQIRRLSAVNEFGDVGTIGLDDQSKMTAYIRDNLNISQAATWRTVYYARKREVHIACTATGATANNYRLVIDFNQGRPRFRISTRDVPICMFLAMRSGLQTLYHGDASGFIWEMDTTTRSKAGVGYASSFQTPHLDLSHIDPAYGTIKKNGKYLELVVDPKGNHDLSVDVFWDGIYHETLLFNMGSTGTALGTFVLGTSALGGRQVLNKKRKLTGRGRRISLIGRNNGAAQDFSVAKFYLHFTPGAVVSA